VELPEEEKKQAEHKVKTMLQPGDMIFVKTSNALYSTLRKIFDNEYDHIVVVVNEHQSLHISWPHAKLVPTYMFSHTRRAPLVVRPLKITDKQRELFIE